ncbi:N-acetylgalactosamine-6-sulfatase [Sphingobacterium alkalisoli]|uniref:N-acetylgalactosamine-6-sulfatase n=1 Tax=Sphingobacterium alkalisoli TaxID=1874115 RepID=A0A4U0GXR0_9SPHI|nr:sulfatase-like hydrolase/transferase [Sphingobacterium alkalisoli]TJY63975.1 N-acetylgalactosamine-6-sulfatase [Sphingobacterium alkalisoli]GGH23693.1 N-acetylgalactosamine-6-sulfatase [Sphingobacterium alkalisoli]
MKNILSRFAGVVRLIKASIVLILASYSFLLKAQDIPKPNIILILADDLGIGDVSCYYGKYSTPNIDKIAAEGIRFTNYYSSSPICSPSRAGILTGQSPAKLHFTTFLNTREDNKRKQQVDYLDPNVPSIAQLLKSEGYVAGHFGKWHMGGGRDVTEAPNFDQYGFDEWSGTYESPDPDPAITATNWIWSDKDSVKRWNRTAYFVEKTLSFLKENKGKPCYVNLWTDDVHTPWVAGDDEVGRYPGKPEEERSFEAVLAEFDQQLGRLMDGLKELGIDHNTLVIFTSDNGPLPTFGQDRSAGLRGSKLSLYEGGINMPFIARWPAKIKKNETDTTSILSALDLFPSFCALAGVDLGNSDLLDGEDRSATWLGRPSPRKEPLIWEYGRNSSFFSFPKAPNRSPALAYRWENWKFLMNLDQSGMELYNLATDKKESVNLVSQHPDLVKKFSNTLLEWWIRLPLFE